MNVSGLALALIPVHSYIFKQIHCHLSCELIRTCIGLQTADILVHIGFVLLHRLRAFQQLVKLRLQGFLFLLIVCKKFSTGLFGHIAKHPIFIELADQFAQIINTLFKLMLTLAVLSVLDGDIALFSCKIFCSCFAVIHYKINLSLNVLQNRTFKYHSPDVVRRTIALAITDVHTAAIGVRTIALRCFHHFHFSTALIAIAQPRQRIDKFLRRASATAHRSVDFLHLVPQLTADDRLMIMLDDNPFGLILADNLVVFVAHRSFLHLCKIADIDLIDKQSLYRLPLPQMP